MTIWEKLDGQRDELVLSLGHVLKQIYYMNHACITDTAELHQHFPRIAEQVEYAGSATESAIFRFGFTSTVTLDQHTVRFVDHLETSACATPSSACTSSCPASSVVGREPPEASSTNATSPVSPRRRIQAGGAAYCADDHRGPEASGVEQCLDSIVHNPTAWKHGNSARKRLTHVFFDAVPWRARG